MTRTQCGRKLIRCFGHHLLGGSAESPMKGRFSNDFRNTNTDPSYYSDQSQHEQTGQQTNQNQNFLAIICNLLEALEKSYVQSTISFGLGSTLIG